MLYDTVWHFLKYNFQVTLLSVYVLDMVHPASLNYTSIIYPHSIYIQFLCFFQECRCAAPQSPWKAQDCVWKWHNCTQTQTERERSTSSSRHMNWQLLPVAPSLSGTQIWIIELGCTATVTLWTKSTPQLDWNLPVLIMPGVRTVAQQHVPICATSTPPHPVHPHQPHRVRHIQYVHTSHIICIQHILIRNIQCFIFGSTPCQYRAATHLASFPGSATITTTTRPLHICANPETQCTFQSAITSRNVTHTAPDPSASSLEPQDTIDTNESWVVISNPDQSIIAGHQCHHLITSQSFAVIPG